MIGGMRDTVEKFAITRIYRDTFSFMETRNLPIGIQDFEKLRKGGCVYVDKTAYVHEMAKTETPYILRLWITNPGWGNIRWDFRMRK